MTPGVKRGLLTAAIAGGVLAAPAYGHAQEMLTVTATVGNDLGAGGVWIFENKGAVSIDIGVPLEELGSSEGRAISGDIGGGFLSGLIMIIGTIGLSLHEDCINLCMNQRYSGYQEPERWHPVGFRAGVGVMVFVRDDAALGAKAIHDTGRGGRYSAWLGFVLEKDEGK